MEKNNYPLQITVHFQTTAIANAFFMEWAFKWQNELREKVKDNIIDIMVINERVNGHKLKEQFISDIYVETMLDLDKLIK